MFSKLMLAVVTLIVSISPVPRAPQPGGGQEGVDILPSVAVVQLANGLIVACTDDGRLGLTENADVTATVDGAESVAVVTDGGVEFAVLSTLIGSAPDAADALAAILAVSPNAAAGSAAPSLAADAHPKQPSTEFKMKKDWVGPDGKPRVRFVTIIVEKRPGEDSEEWIERSEREVEKWEKKGYTTVP